MNWINLIKAISIVTLVFASPFLLGMLAIYVGIANLMLVLMPVMFVVFIILIYKALNY